MVLVSLVYSIIISVLNFTTYNIFLFIPELSHNWHGTPFITQLGICPDQLSPRVTALSLDE